MNFLKILHLFVVFILIGLAGPDLDSALADAPKATVEQLLKAITQLHHKKPLTPEQQQSNDMVSRQVVALMDVRKVSQKTLGKYWKERSKKEQDEFVQLLGDIFRYVAFPNSSKFFGEMDINYAATKRDGKTATVPMTVVHKGRGKSASSLCWRRIPGTGKRWTSSLTG
jgi:phospholipid transport system substrate-binding protein